MKSIIFSLSVLITSIISSDGCLAQIDERVDQVVYLIGNTATREINEAQLANLQEQLLTEKSPYTLLHLGDIIHPDKPENWPQELDLLFNLMRDRENGQIISVGRIGVETAMLGIDHGDADFITVNLQSVCNFTNRDGIGKFHYFRDKTIVAEVSK